MSGFRSLVFKFAALTGMLLGLPLFGVYLAGYPVSVFLEFPPVTQYVKHVPVSQIALVAFAIGIIVVYGPLAARIVVAYMRRRNSYESAYAPFPWWGWLGLVTGLASWFFAWTRFPWFEAFQPHTFAPLWFSYILMINGLCYRRTGHCMMLDRTRLFLSLFPASAVFWWYFEYLNRFVQNWRYVGAEYGPWTYFCLATISFSTVLPAVLSTQEWILSYKWFREGFENFRPIQKCYPSLSAWLVLIVFGIGLTGIGIWPNYLFPLVWVSPAAIIVALQSILKERHILADLAKGDLIAAISACVAALICGIFWEMWNYYSLARWIYSVPLVHTFPIFEMPVLGFAGYPPFGLECLAVSSMIERAIQSREPGSKAGRRSGNPLFVSRETRDQ